MPPLSPPESLGRALDEGQRRAEAVAWIDEHDLPAHRALSRRAAAMTRANQAGVLDSDMYTTTIHTRWCENPDLAEGGRKVQYRLEHDTARHRNDRTPKTRLVVRVSEPDRLRPGETMEATASLVHFGDHHSVVFERDGVQNTPGSYQAVTDATVSIEEGRHCVAIPSDGQSFRDVEATLDLIEYTLRTGPQGSGGDS